MLYWHESRGFAPYYNGGGTPASTPGPNMFQIEWFQQFLKPTQYDQVRRCPEADEPNMAYWPAVAPTGSASGPNMPGTAFNCWGPYGRAMQYFDPATWPPEVSHMKGSYTENGYCLKLSTSGNGNTLMNEAGRGGSAAQLELGKNRLLKYPIKNASEVPVLSDGVWPTGWIKSTDNVVTGGSNIYSLYFSAGTGGNGGALNIGNDWRRILVARHGFAINVAFADGHAETVQLPDLWKLKWHSLWNPIDLPAGQTPESIKAYLVSLYKQGV